MRPKRLGQVLFIAISLLLLMMLSLAYGQQVSRAQNELIVTKTLNQASNVVRVGEVLSFTIALTNNAGFTLTNVTLVDEYASNVLGFAGAIPPQDQHDPATGVITWDNVAAPPLAIGGSLTFTVFFTAEHPQTAVVNFVRAQDITGTQGAISDTQATDQLDEAVGGAAPIVKSISPPGSMPQTGLPVTFTHLITNDGGAFMTFLPLTDTYDPAFLEFNFGIPTPNITSPPGLLVWTNLASTTYFGPITPDTTVVVTTVFTATTQVISTVNRASTEGARDEFNNDLTADEALVPITIIADTPTPAPIPTQDDDADDDDKDSSAPAPTAIPTATPAPTAVASQEVITGPTILPETGQRDTHRPNLVPLVGLILLTGVIYFLKMRKSIGKE